MVKYCGTLWTLLNVSPPHAAASPGSPAAQQSSVTWPDLSGTYPDSLWPAPPTGAGWSPEPRQPVGESCLESSGWRSPTSAPPSELWPAESRQTQCVQVFFTLHTTKCLLHICGWIHMVFSLTWIKSFPPAETLEFQNFRLSYSIYGQTSLGRRCCVSKTK